ncbi:hypothetical protein HZP13_03440 [Elizabethkingia anophelis]|nr:hypothetical protein [Elizabethkingia anophelis]OPC49204.1 hypothetical protein BAY05_02200 [Elizabethkingia anophelis]
MMNLMEKQLEFFTPIVKKNYSPPTLDFMLLEMEFGLAAASSASIQVGDPTNNSQPQVEDWQDGNNDGSNIYL